jgi:hypothetical protein
MAQCTVLYYTTQHSYGHSEPRCRCSFHGVEFFYGTAPTQLCPVGHLEDRILALENQFADLVMKVLDVNDRIDKHEQDYYDAQYPKNVRTG